MKISVDTDGTKTDFSKFIRSYEKYFIKNHNMPIVNHRGLEVEEVYDIENTLISRGYTADEAANETKRIVKKFWVSAPRFINFSLLSRFRDGVTKRLNELKRQGHELEIDTARDKTTETNIVGKVARNFTLCQYALNGLFLQRKRISFYANDDEKIEGIKRKGSKLVFDDKPYVIEKVSKFTKVICVNNPHNENKQFNENVFRIDNFSKIEIETSLKALFGERDYEYILRNANAEKFFQSLKPFLKPLFLRTFNPILLNEQNIIRDGSVIYAPNHRSTLDPLAVITALEEPIHWVALKRFFTGNDSIFNNSKNPILCKLTSYVFKKMELIPIERKMDNENADNIQSFEDINGFLRIGGRIGIFPEGTTLKKPYTTDFGHFRSSFLTVAEENNSHIQPITIYWIKNLGLKEKVIINFGKAFKVENMSIEEGMEHYSKIQQENMKEIRDFIFELTPKNKVLKK